MGVIGGHREAIGMRSRDDHDAAFVQVPDAQELGALHQRIDDRVPSARRDNRGTTARTPADTHAPPSC